MWRVPYIWLTELMFPKPTIDQLLRRRGKLGSTPSCCKWFWCIFSEGETVLGWGIGLWGTLILFWLLHFNMWHKLCAAFSLFRDWIIFIFQSANKLQLVHALLILVQGVHRIINSVGEKCSHWSNNKKYLAESEVWKAGCGISQTWFSLGQMSWWIS